MSAALTPPAPPSPAAGATQGMPASPQQPNPFAARFTAIFQQVEGFIRALTQVPGINQDMLKQAAEKFQEGATLLFQAAGGKPPQQAGAPMPQAGAPGAPPPPGARPQ